MSSSTQNELLAKDEKLFPVGMVTISQGEREMFPALNGKRFPIEISLITMKQRWKMSRKMLLF